MRRGRLARASSEPAPIPSVHTYDLTWSVRVLDSVPFASAWRDRGEKKEFGADHVLCLSDPAPLQRTISIGDVASDTTDGGPTTRAHGPEPPANRRWLSRMLHDPAAVWLDSE